MKTSYSIIKITSLSLAINIILSCGKQDNYSSYPTIKPEIKNGVFLDLATRMQNTGTPQSTIIQADKDMRIKVTEGVKEALLNQYSLIHLKEKRILTSEGQKFNTKDHLNKCIEIENNTDDTSDLHFIDRLKQCIAGFKDTHLGINARVSTPSVNVGILIRKIADKYYIYARQPELLDYLKKANKDENIDDITAVGNEVIQIDGKSPAELSKHYATFVRASSDDYQNSVADLNILYRDFDYPTKNFVEITIKSPKKIYHYKLPWWASLETLQRQDAKEYFDSLGIPTSARVRMLYGKDEKIDWDNIKSSFKGYLESDPIVKADPFSPLVTFKSDKGTLAARMGVINTPLQSFCYLELLTFSSEKLIPENGDKAESYLDTVKSFVKSCKTKNLNLVIDLRSNNGGYGSYPYKILSYLANPESRLGGKIIAYRPTQISARLVSSMLNHPELNSGDLDDIDERSLIEIQRTLPLQQLMTGALPVTQDIVPDLDIGGFTGKVLALVTPACISACDGMSALLKRSGRGVLIGTHSNGTGAGFIDSDSLDSIYRDSYLEVAMKIPNYQFGYSSHPFANLNPIDFDSNAEEYFTENRPAVADIQIDTTLDDILGKKQTWLNAVIEKLSEL